MTSESDRWRGYDRYDGPEYSRQGRYVDLRGPGHERHSRQHSGDWMRDRQWWETNYGTRQYASADRSFSDYEPGYRFGYESVNKYRGRQWNDVEPDLQRDWDRYEHRGNSTWENVKHSVRDAWDRLTVTK